MPLLAYPKLARATFLALSLAGLLTAAPVKFDIPAQPLAPALQLFMKQSGTEVAFPPDDLKNTTANALAGEYEPRTALDTLLKGTGFTATERKSGWFTVVRADSEKPGSIEGQVRDESGRPVPNARVSLAGSELGVLTDRRGRFLLEDVPAGAQSLGIMAEGMQRTKVTDVTVRSGHRHTLSAITIPAVVAGITQLEDYIVSAKKNEGVLELDPYEVEGRREKPFTSANIDLPRTINDAQPYYIFDSETLDRSGAVNIEDFLKQRLTMNTTSQTFSQIPTAGTSANASQLNLRGLGTDKTLILVNGRRRAGVSTLGDENQFQTDLNGIPFGAIERIEVLPTSASGIYGGSAIGGVINVVLKRRYNGGNLSMTYENATSGDAPRRTVDALYGFSLEDGRTNVMLTGSWSDSEPMLFEDRADIYRNNLAGIVSRNPSYIINSAFPPLGATVNIMRSGGGNLILQSTGESLGSQGLHLPPGVSPTTSPAQLEAILRSNPGFNLELARTAQPLGLLRPLSTFIEVRSVGLSVDRNLTPWLDAHFETSWSENLARGIEAVHPFYIMRGTSLLPPFADNPLNPFTSNVRIAIPMPSNERQNSGRGTSTQVLVGLKAQLPREWVALLDFQVSNYRSEIIRPELDFTEIDRRLQLGLLNPFVDPSLYPWDLGELWFQSIAQSRNRLTTVSLRGAGKAFDLPWGSARLAVGLGHDETHIPAQTNVRKLPFHSDLHALFGQVDFVQSTYARKQTVDSLYAEMDIPLARGAKHAGLYSLSAQLSGRADRSEADAGTIGLTRFEQMPPQIQYMGQTFDGQPYFTTQEYDSRNLTFGLKYQPISWMTVRASHGTAFLPVLPTQLQEDPTTYIETVSDPARGTTANVRVIRGGNPDLRPQNSKSVNVGIIFEPQTNGVTRFRFGAEYYRIKQYDAIADFALSMESLFPDRVVRDSSGFITQLDRRLVNLFLRDTSGLDLNASYEWKSPIGRIMVQATESFISELRTQYAPTLPAYDSVGYHPLLEGGAPKRKGNASFAWDWRGYTAGWAMTYVSSYKQIGAAGGPLSIQFYDGAQASGTDGQYILAQGGDTIAAQAYHDLFFRYTFDGGKGRAPRLLTGLSVTLGVKNVLNSVPPLDVANNLQFYTSSFGDAQLRRYWVNIKKSF